MQAPLPPPRQRVWLLRRALEERSAPGVQLAAAGAVAALDSADAERSLEARLEGARHAGEPAEAVQVEPAADGRGRVAR